MKLILLCMPVHPALERKSMNSMPTTALYYLSSILDDHEITHEIIDPYIIRKILYSQRGIIDLEKFVEKFLGADVILAISSNTLNWSMTKLLLDILEKKKSKCTIILGGLHPTYFPEELLKNSIAQYLIRGEGENALPKLILGILEKRNLAYFEKIENLSWKNENKIIHNHDAKKISIDVLQKYPCPDFSKIPNKVYDTMPVMTSKGCLFNCAFCSIPNHNSWRGYDSEWAINNLAKMYNRYMDRFINKSIYITDDCFTVDMFRSEKILDGIERNNIQADFMIEARVNDIRKLQYCEMIVKHKWLTRVACGVECGYDEGLKKIGKVLKIRECIDLLEKAEKYDFMDRLAFSFIIGFPWESKDDCIKTIDFAANIVKKYGIIVNLNWLQIFPSKIWEKRKEYGIFADYSFFEDKGLLGNAKASTAQHELSYDLEFVSKTNMFNPRSFLKTRPLISYEDGKEINDYILNIESTGIALRNS